MNGKGKHFEKVLYLTDQEYRIFKLLGEGLPPKDIARLPGRRIASGTVHSYLDRIRARLDERSLFKIVRLAVLYNESGLKRVAALPTQPFYRFK